MSSSDPSLISSLIVSNRDSCEGFRRYVIRAGAISILQVWTFLVSLAIFERKLIDQKAILVYLVIRVWSFPPIACVEERKTTILSYIYIFFSYSFLCYDELKRLMFGYYIVGYWTLSNRPVLGTRRKVLNGLPSK